MSNVSGFSGHFPGTRFFLMDQQRVASFTLPSGNLT
jgi:hypothetical protein